ncbi:MAG: hypothetical protein COA36_11060 [Desulfotalea sp.]|nr:MAG: hypothetical protein COA36_11060 [Desulfotalea sp.]
MQVHVKLYGTLPKLYLGDYPKTGLDVAAWQGLTVAELVQLVPLPHNQVAIVSINGFLAKAADAVPQNAQVKFFQPINGG